ncbi:MAG: FtsW/RodA/SpoVE family cell cycle protein [bacterium]|nr:FtsW/RodA/SpoVE family cell cycle protein [bacterium]
MASIFNHLKRLDWVLMGAIALVFVMGLLIFYGGAESRQIFWRQLIFGSIGFLLVLILSFFDWRIIKESSFFSVAIYVFGLVLLFILFAVGAKVRGVTSWFRFGAFNFEPVELIKIILVAVLAKYFSSRFIELHKWKNILISSLYAGFPSALVLLQPDLGSAVVLMVLWFGMILLAGIKTRQVLAIVFLVLTAAIFMWNYGLADYQKNRITSFIYPDRDPLGGSYQSRQAMIAIGSGGLFGKGIGRGTETRLGFLPEYETDFIFAAIGEELGLIGISILLIGWFTIFFRLYKGVVLAPDNFSKLFIAGISIVLCTHFAVNIGANLGFLPITGIPLSFVSNGGSNFVSLCVGIGIIQAMRARVYHRISGNDSVLLDS